MSAGCRKKKNGEYAQAEGGDEKRRVLSATGMKEQVVPGSCTNRVPSFFQPCNRAKMMASQDESRARPTVPQMQWQVSLEM